MTTSVPAGKLGGTEVALRDLLRREHMQGRLLPWLHRRVLDVFLADQARALGLRVEDGELQEAADWFRRRNRLLSAAETQEWLTKRRLTGDDLETALESDLLVRKLRGHVAASERVSERFGSRPADYDRLRLRNIALPREDLAREIHSQINDEGADFAELARQHSLLPNKRHGGLALPRFRCQLPMPVREALADAKTGVTVGPVADKAGFFIIRVEELAAAELNPATTAFISRQLFRDWLRQQLAAAPFYAPLLDALA